MRPILFSALSLLLAASPLAAQSAHDRLTTTLKTEWEYQLKVNPELATAIGDTRYNDRLSDNSPAAYERAAEHAKAALKTFEAIGENDLNAEDRLNRLLMLRSLQRKIEGAPFKS